MIPIKNKLADLNKVGMCIVSLKEKGFFELDEDALIPGICMMVEEVALAKNRMSVNVAEEVAKLVSEMLELKGVYKGDAGAYDVPI